MGSFDDGLREVRFDNLESLTGRVGGRVARSWAVEEAATDKPARLATVWGQINIWQEFLDATSTTSFSSATGFIPFTADLSENWVEVGLGGSLQMTATTTLYGNINYETPLDGGGYGIDGNIGLRVNW